MTMLIITGPGRSGTSVLALFCKNMGYDPGGEWYDAVDAGLENERVVKINDALRRDARETGGVEQSLRMHAEEMRNLRVAVVKDPRFTLHPAVLCAWRSVRDDISVLITYRTPEDCVASHQRRADYVMERRGKQADDIRRQMADSIENLLRLEIPFEMLLFPDFLGQFNRVCSHLRSLGLDLDPERAHRVWSDVVDRDKVHIGPSPRPAVARTTDLDPDGGEQGIQQRIVQFSKRLRNAVHHNR